MNADARSATTAVTAFTAARAGEAGPAAPRTGVRVLVVDDEPGIAGLVATVLRYEGFDVRTAGSGAEALAEARRHDPQLLVLDVMLPDLDGFELYGRLARGGRLPTVFLTARDDTEDTIRGLTMGADDYLTKPFSLEELVARIRAVLRRAGLEERRATPLAIGSLTLDDDARSVTCGGVPVALTATEYNLLRYLMQHAGRVVSKRQILDHVWQYDFGGQANVVEIYVGYLRRKLTPLAAPSIETVRGFGYLLRRPEAEPAR